MKIGVLLAVVMAAIAAFPVLDTADAQVRVRGHYRSDGTYVRPHVRSSPNSTTSDNYGPSRTSPFYSGALPDLSLVPPQTRDADRDGFANMYDADDDDDGIGDDSDRTQYGRATANPTFVWTPYGLKRPD